MKGPFSESPRPCAYLQGATAQRIACADYRGLPPSQRPTRGRESGPDEEPAARLRERAAFVGVDHVDEPWVNRPAHNRAHHAVASALGGSGGQCLRMAAYVRGPAITRGGNRPERASVAHAR